MAAPPPDYAVIVQELVDELKRSAETDEHIKEEVEVLTKVIEDLRMEIDSLDAPDLKFPNKLRDELKDAVRKNLKIIVEEDEIIKRIKGELNDMLEKFYPILNYLKGLHAANDEMKKHTPKMANADFHKHVARYVRGVEDIENHGASHNLDSVKVMLKELDDVMEKFDALQAEEGREHKAIIDLEKILDKIKGELKTKWEATLKIKARLVHYKKLKKNLQDVAKIILDTHSEIRKESAFMDKLRHLNPYT